MFFISDTHFKHGNIIKYCNRPFSSVEEMDEAMIENWNEVVRPNDTVYHLGDFMFARGYKASEQIADYASRLNGKIHLILGNHDHLRDCLNSKAFESINTLLKMRHDNQKIILCHYALRVWDCAHHGAWHLYGHSHGTLPDIGGLTFDVGVDRFNYKPVHFDVVRDIMRNRDPKMSINMDHHISQLKEE